MQQIQKSFQSQTLFLCLYTVMFLVAVCLGQAWFSWFALQLVCSTIYISGRSKRLSPVWILASIFLAFGFWIGLQSDVQNIHKVGVICCLIGTGGLLGWFPVPFGRPLFDDSVSPISQLSNGWLPSCIAALFFFQCVSTGDWVESELAILSVVSLSSLLLCGLRLNGDVRCPEWCRFAALATLSNANIATVLHGWQVLHSERSWSESSNLMTGKMLFVYILTLETIGFFLLIWGLTFIRSRRDISLTEKLSANLPSKIERGSLALYAGALSLTGFPLFPGSWWRFQLSCSLILPQEQSLVTQLSEPHVGFISLAIAYVLCSIVVAIGNLNSLLTVVENHTLSSSSPGTESRPAIS